MSFFKKEMLKSSFGPLILLLTVYSETTSFNVITQRAQMSNRRLKDVLLKSQSLGPNSDFSKISGEDVCMKTS